MSIMQQFSGFFDKKNFFSTNVRKKNSSEPILSITGS